VDLAAPGFSTFTGPCIDQTVFGPTVAGNYWSASTGAGFGFGAWAVNFDVRGGGECCNLYTRAVRSGL
jgi:hypothetical protein